MKTVFFDIDTQIDFLFPAGALYVPKAERLVPVFSHLNRYAAAHDIPVVSDMDAHTEDDPEFRIWPAHCVVGTPGQGKPASTLLEKRIVVANRPGDLALDGARQILIEKQTLDVFDTCTVRPILERLQADRFVVYGVVTEYCVRLASLGLLATGKPVTVLTDAVETLNPADAARMFEELRARGGKLATVAEVCRE